jgi:hypothetical protein
MTNYSDDVRDPRDFFAHIPFLSRQSLYQTEKPFGADFPVYHIDGANITNQIFDIHQVKIRDARQAPDQVNLNEHGFCCLKSKTSLRPDEAATTRTPAIEKYITEVLTFIRNEFPDYIEIRIMDFQVSINLPQLNTRECSVRRNIHSARSERDHRTFQKDTARRST